MSLQAKLAVNAHGGGDAKMAASEKVALRNVLPRWSPMEKDEMDEESKRTASVSMLRSPPHGQLEVTHTDKLSGECHASHAKELSDVAEPLFITPVEWKLWEQLLWILSTSLWEVKVSRGLQEDSVILFFGSPEAVSRAKKAVSNLLITVSSLVRASQMALPQTEHRAAGFFHPQKGPDLFLWEGDTSKFRVDAVVRLGTSGGIGCGTAVLAQRVLSQRGSPQTNLDVLLPYQPTVELAAGAVKLALEAASQRGLQSLVMSSSGLAMSASQSKAMAAGIEAFNKEHPDSPLKSINFVSGDGDAVAAFCKECEKRWPSGKDDHERLRNMLLSLEAVRTEVIAGSSPKKKTDVTVVPLVLESDGLGWGPRTHAITQKAVEVAPQAMDLQPGEVLSVTSAAFPEFDCSILYMVWLEGSQLRLKDAQEAIRKMVWSCLNTFYGSFLESISFPIIEPAESDLALKQEYLLIMLEEINHFLKEVPNTWMKLVQIVPLPGQTTPWLVEDYVTTAVEPVGVCHPEDPLFLWYLDENPGAFHHLKVQLKEVGYGIQMCAPWRMLVFQVTSEPLELYDLGAKFQSVRDKYTVHCETRQEILDAMLEQLSLVDEFKSIRTYVNDKLWFVGLSDEMASFLQHLTQGASQRQLVSWEYSAEPLPRCTIAKDIEVQEMLPSNPLVSTEILAKTPATIRFWGRCQRVEEAVRRFKELLGGFQVLPVPLSDFQSQFVRTLWGELFYNEFFLEQGIPAVLEISEGVQVAGLDLNKMKEAEKILLRQVCERTVEITEEVKWATECEEWRELLHRLGSHKQIALHHIASNQVTVVGTCLYITQVEESIKEYLQDNSPAEERMKFARPELAAMGQNLLRIMNWGHLKVNVKLQANSQVLSLQVSGLQKYVQKAMPAIKIDVDSLVLSTIPLKKKVLGEYFSGVGAGVLKEMVLQCCCVARMQIREILDHCSRVTNSDGSWEQRSAKEDHPVVIYAVGRESHTASLKQAVADFIAMFHECSVCNEAIVTFSDKFLNKLCMNTLHWFPISLCRLRDDTLQICGSQEDVDNVLGAIHKKIEEYQAEWIEAKAQYETVPCIIVKECLAQKILPFKPLVSIEILAENPVTVTFKGPRQKLVETKRCLEGLLSGYRVVPVPFSDLQAQFVKEQWGELFSNSFFFEKGILAMLEISQVVHIAGLDLSTLKEAEEIIMKHVHERIVEIDEEVKWATECEEWRELLHQLGSCKETALHHIVSNQVTVVGICPHIIQAEESIKEYLGDNSTTDERVYIARPEIAFAGDSLLCIMDWDNLNVTIQVQSNTQFLSLHVSGLKKYVQEAIQVVRKHLDSLVFGTMPLKKSLDKYFSGAGANLLQEMAQEHKCIAKIQSQKSSSYCDGVTTGSRIREERLADDTWAVIHLVGRETDVASCKKNVACFMAKFHKETICSAEIPAFSDEILEELCKNTSHRFPVALHRLREKVVQVCGSQEDVENVLGAIYTKIEKAVNAKIQEAQAEWIESKLLYQTVQWRRMTDAGWCTFDMATNRSLEMAYGKKKMRVQVPWEGQNIEIDLLKSEAFMPGNRKTFKITREICLWDKNIAPHWEPMDECLVKKVELQTRSEEYQNIVKNFRQTSNGYTVLKVERIQNLYLWVSYCWKRSWMEKKNPNITQNERILYHGTRPENWHSIQEIGFKSACRRTGLYGQGIYFSGDAGHSAYYAEPNPHGHRFIFQARVLIGEYSRGDEKMVLPPMKPGGRGRYDSLVNVSSKPTIFVTFFDDHAYPEYLITFCG